METVVAALTVVRPLWTAARQNGAAAGTPKPCRDQSGGEGESFRATLTQASLPGFMESLLPLRASVDPATPWLCLERPVAPIHR